MITNQRCVQVRLFFALTLSAFSVHITYCQDNFEIPDNIAEFIVGAVVTEDNRLVSTSLTSNKEFELYVIENWADMLNSLEDLPQARGTTAAVVGHAAESLSGLEYLSFLNEFVRLFNDGTINDRVLGSQLAGYDEKHYFLAVNYDHPLVKKFLDYAIDSISESESESVDWMEYLDAVKSGTLRDMYQSNSSSRSPLPETLPGITLAEPFESMLATINDSRDVELRADEGPREPRLQVGASKPYIWVIGGFAIAFVSRFMFLRSLRKRRKNV